MQKEWYREDSKKILNHFNVASDRGLTPNRVLENRQKFGQNVLSEEETKTIFDIFISQFKSPLIYVLIFAFLIGLFLGDYIEAGVIAFIIILNAVIGTAQEGRAQNTLAALKKIVKSYVTVVRGGVQERIPDYELVPGDIILLKDGDAVGADARLIESTFLKVNESSLTGESSLVEKISEPIVSVSPVTADQINMVFRGTYVVSGLGRAVVVNTGLNTVVGKIARKLSALHMDVPLKKNIANLSRVLIIVACFFVVLIFMQGVASGVSFINMLKTVVAVAVSAVPEGLPVVVTVVLASGVWRMSKQNVLVKNLQAVEALGQAKVIALDKTGTITKNQMAVEKIFFNNKTYTVSGIGYEPKGVVIFDNKIVDVKSEKGLELFVMAGTLTAIAEIVNKKPENEWILNYGDPTEAAMFVLGKKLGYDKNDLLKKYPKILEIPFDMENKHHTIVNQFGKKKMLSITGGPELILKHSTKIWSNGRAKKMTKTDSDMIHSRLFESMNSGYRILAVAINMDPGDEVNPKHLPELTFLGFVCITDAIRPEVASSVKMVRDAGIKVLMITGDHVDTAKSIAEKVGIYKPGDKTMTGGEMAEISDTDLVDAVVGVTVFARVTPNDKLRIIEAYKRRKETIAMTGDGVNDALSLVAADLGVAMGKIGTEVAREASDIILLDDKFGNIVAAAEEGRNIFKTIKNSIFYLLSTSLGELVVIVTALFIGLPIPLSPVQIIWLNLITGTILVLGLIFEPKDKDLLKEKFKKPSKYILDTLTGIRMILIATTMMVVTLFVFTEYLDSENTILASTVALTTLCVLQWYNIFNAKSEKKSMFSNTFFKNKYLFIGLSIVVILQLFAIYNPLMQKALKVTALGISEWILILTISTSIIFVEEIRKYLVRLKDRRFSI